MNLFKIIISWAIAIFIAGLFFSLFLAAMGIAFKILFQLAYIILIVVIALPLFVIIRKKLFK